MSEKKSLKKGYLEEEFRLFHLKDANGTQMEVHCHDFHKIVILISGRGEYIIEGRRYELKGGDIAVVPALTSHKPEFEPGVIYERYVLYISPDFLQKTVGNVLPGPEVSGEKSSVLRMEGQSRERILSLAAQLEEEGGDKFGGRAYAGALMTALVVETARAFRKETNLVPALEKNSRTREILAYIDSHLAEELTVDMLAARFFVSKYHMMRRFREEIGRPLHAYISDKRLFSARNMILSGVPAMEACFLCGFQSYSAFARAFEKRYGTAPTGKSMTRLPRTPENE